MSDIISNAFKSVTRRLLSSRGNILVYIVLLMLIFGVLGVTMVSLFSTSISSTATQNDTRRATYLSEAGTRYAMSEMLSGDFSKTAIDDLNDNTEYTLGPTSKFWINVFSPWFELNAASYDFGIDGPSIPLKVPEGRIPSGYLGTIPGGGTIPGSDPDFFLVNYDYFPTTTPPAPPDTAISLVDVASSGSDTTLQFTLADDFVASRDEQICMAVAPFSGDQSIPSLGYLDLMPVARNIFPPLGGAFQVQRRNFFYSKRDDSLADRVRLTGISSVAGESSSDVTVAAGDPVILSPRNRLIVARGRSGEVEFGDNTRYATGFSDVSVAEPQSLKPDIEFDEEADLPGVLSQVEQSIGVVNVYNDPGNKYLSLSASGGSFGAVWFRDTRSIGGIRNFCQTGGCLFNIGFRAFFLMNFSGTDGDGFTFSILNRSNNDVGSVGGDISLSELLAYAGDSRTTPNPAFASDFLDGRSGQGLLAPKMAVEFDGKRSTQSQTICQDLTPGGAVYLGSRFDPDFSGNDRDVVQYVFWGRDSLINAPCRTNPLTGTNKTYDDNRHDTVNAIWVYDSGYARVSSPAVDDSDPLNVRIYTGRSSNSTQNDAGGLIRLNPSNGIAEWTRNPDETSGNDDDIDSSPTIDSSSRDIYVGNDSFWISRYDATGTREWRTLLSGNIEGKPYLSSSRVYAVTDRNPLANARLYSLSKEGTIQWSVDIGTTDGDYTSSPVSSGGNLIYVGSLNGSLYVIRDDGGAGTVVRQYPTSGPIRSTPAINPASSPNPVSNHVYFGSDDGTIYFLRGDGTEYRLVTPTPIAPVVSSPTVTSDGARVYVGSNNGHLYALNTLNGSQIWRYPDPSRNPSDPTRIGDVRGSPTIASDGAVLFGSDDGHLYALNPDGTLRWKYPAIGSIGAVRSKPAIGPDGIIYFGAEDGNLYALDPAVNDPPNIQNLFLTSAELDASGSYTNNWFTEGPWAVRLEVQRSITPNVSGNYEYTLKTWLKKCQDADCSNLAGTPFFQNTRFEYDWATAGITPMTQTIELSNTATPPPGQLDFLHDRFDRFLFGFTSASTTSQTIEIRKFQLSFIRPNDPIVSD